MQHARQHTSATNWHMSTKGQGKINSAARGSLTGPIETDGGLNIANASHQPADFVAGPGGQTGEMDPCNYCDLDDYGNNPPDADD